MLIQLNVSFTLPDFFVIKLYSSKWRCLKSYFNCFSLSQDLTRQPTLGALKLSELKCAGSDHSLSVSSTTTIIITLVITIIITIILSNIITITLITITIIIIITITIIIIPIITLSKDVRLPLQLQRAMAAEAEAAREARAKVIRFAFLEIFYIWLQYEQILNLISF